MRSIYLVTVVAFVSAAGLFGAGHQVKVNGIYVATAYSQLGKTASGDYVHRHVIAADPDVLPIGSVIKLRFAGKYSGEYVVADTGQNIQGRRLDIFIPSTRECKRFGRKHVLVRVVSVGDGTHAATRQADQAVKQDVKTDLSKSVVGNAATETDWAVKKANEARGVPPPVADEKAASAAAPKAAADTKKNAHAPATDPQ